MSAEEQFRAALAAHAPLVEVVGTRIALNAVPEDNKGDLIVFTCAAVPWQTLAGVDDTQQATITVHCWAADPRALADLVRAAIATAPAERSAYVLSDETLYSPELDRDGVELTVEWWP